MHTGVISVHMLHVAARSLQRRNPEPTILLVLRSLPRLPMGAYVGVAHTRAICHLVRSSMPPHNHLKQAQQALSKQSKGGTLQGRGPLHSLPHPQRLRLAQLLF